MAGTSGAYAAGATGFAEEDTNHDGQMSWGGVTGRFPDPTRALFDTADEDKSSTISEAEYTALFVLCPAQ